MYKIFLRDEMTQIIDYVIITETTTPKEIKDIIDKIKKETPDYTIGNIIAKLPKDCKVINGWNNNFTIIYY